jgi:predicted small secreted protein
MTKRLLIVICAAAVLVSAMTACHTVHGAGEDIESVGKAMEGD